jgi:hypothetical protein
LCYKEGQRWRNTASKGGTERGDRGGAYIRARSVVEGCHDFIEKGKIEFFVEIENALHRDDAWKWLGMWMWDSVLIRS